MSLLPHFHSIQQQRLALAGIVAVCITLLLIVTLTSTSVVLGVALLCVAGYVAWKEPMWIVLFLIAWWPFEPFLLKFIGDDIYVFARYASEVLIYLAAVSVALGLFTGRYTRRATPIDAPFLLFVFIVLVSSILNALPLHDVVLGTRQILRFLLLFFIVVYRYPRRYWMRWAVGILVGILVFQSLLGIAQTLSGGNLDAFLLPTERRTYGDIQLTEGTVQFWDPGQRVFGTMGRYDRLGAFLAFVLLVVLALVYESDRVPSWRFWGLTAIVALPALLLTYSRSAWFGFLLGGLAIAWVRKDKRVLMGALVIALVLGSALAFSGIQRTLADVPRQSLTERFFEAFSYERFRGEYFGLGRVFWIVHTPTTVVPHSIVSALFGWGPASFGGGAVAALHNTRAYDTVGLPFGVYGTEGYVDNNWMSLWGETGTLGFAFYLWLYVALLVLAVRLAKHATSPFGRALGAAYVGVSIAVAVNASLATFLEIRTLAPYLWVFAGCMVVVANREHVMKLR